AEAPLKMIPIRKDSAGATFSVRVHPRARKNAITGILGNALKLSLIAPPVEGRANDAVIEVISEVLRLPRSSVTIAAGHRSRNKVVRVNGITADTLRQRLEQILAGG
ncbi:MAG: DUF167 domain-containing protein, partial [Terriglobales bacterium]